MDFAVGWLGLVGHRSSRAVRAVAEPSRVTQSFCLGCTAQGAVIELASLEILPSGAAMAPSKLRRAFLADAEEWVKVGLAAPTCSTASLTWSPLLVGVDCLCSLRATLGWDWTEDRASVGTDPSADPVAETVLHRSKTESSCAAHFERR